MHRKYFGNEALPHMFRAYLGSATVDSATEPPVPPIEYDYPTFVIDANGDLIATYATTNTDLVFALSGTNLVATYAAQDPKLAIVGSDLFAEV